MAGDRPGDLGNSKSKSSVPLPTSDFAFIRPDLAADTLPPLLGLFLTICPYTVSRPGGAAFSSRDAKDTRFAGDEWTEFGIDTLGD